MGFNSDWKNKRWGHERENSPWNGWRGYSILPPPLIADDAAIAYSLRRVVRDADKCIRVRRSFDNAEQDIGFDGNGDLDTNALRNFVVSDILSGNDDAVAAYSFRKVNPDYTGEAVRVRRSSDNAERDVGFDGNGNLDLTELSNLVNEPVASSENPTIALSLRRAVEGYTGSAVRVRRSSDNAEQDIGFDTMGNFDKDAFTAFVGAGTGYVTKLYDQSGNGHDFSQSTPSEQPTINTAYYGGRGGIKGGGSGMQLELDGNVNWTPSNPDRMVFSVMAPVSTPVGGEEFFSGGSTATVFEFATYTIPSDRIRVRNTGSVFSAQGTFPYGESCQFTVLGGNNRLQAWRNGTVIITNRTSNTFSWATTTLVLLGSNFPGREFDGAFAEIIVFEADKTASRETIENSQSNYWLGSRVNGLVTKWYDQSGNSRDLLQSAGGAQPKIVEDGILITTDGDRPAMESDGVDDYLSPTAFSQTTPTNKLSFFSVLEIIDQPTNYKAVISFYEEGHLDHSHINALAFTSDFDGGGTNDRFLLYRNYGINRLDIRDNKNYPTGFGETLQVTVEALAGTGRLRVNNINGNDANIIAPYSDTNVIDYEGISLGARYNNGFGYFNKIKYSELIVFDDVQTANSTSFEDNQINYWIKDETDYDGFVIRWYDQCEDERDVSQTLAARQPKIMDKGSIVRVNGKPAIDFTDNFLESQSAGLPSTTANIFIFTVWKKDLLTNGGMNFNLNSPSDLNHTVVYGPWSNGVVYWDAGDYLATGRLYTPANIYSDTDQHHFTFAKQAGVNRQIIRRDKVLLAQRTQGTPTTPLGEICVGARFPTINTGYMADFTYQEIMVFLIDKWNEINAIETNQENYWID